MTVWDPTKYLEFADERSRPFVDLLNRVDVAEPTVVVDLGCGPGQLTASLADRWPSSHIIGLDSSPEMIKDKTGHIINIGGGIHRARERTGRAVLVADAL